MDRKKAHKKYMRENKIIENSELSKEEKFVVGTIASIRQLIRETDMDVNIFDPEVNIKKVIREVKKMKGK